MKRLGFGLCRVLGILLVYALAVGGAPTGLAQTETPTSYSHYNLEVTFDPYRHTIGGRETIEYVNTSDGPLSAVVFWLLANYDREPNPYLDPSQLDASYPNGFDPAWTRIQTVTDAEGTELPYELLAGPAFTQTYSLTDTLLRVDLPESLAPGESVELIIEFTTKFPNTLRGDQSRYRDVYTWRFGWYPIAVPAEELIGGEYLTPDRETYRFALPTGLYELTLTLPTGYEAAIGVDHQEVIDESEDTRTIHAINATPVRSVPVTISARFRTYELPSQEIPITVYYLPGHEAAARLIATYAVDSLRYYRKRWGEYPRRRLLIAETASAGASFGAAAADALVLLNQTFFSEKDLGVPGLLDRFLDYIVAHEIAHQWWGIGIGADWNAENFLSESFAQYFSITYFEEKYGEFGPNVFQLERDGILERFVEAQFGYLNLREHLQGNLPYMQAVRNRFDEAIIKPQKDVKYANFSGERVYNKGYLMLRALRGILGRETMDEFLKASEERFLYKIATVQELEALAREVSGQDLTEFFQNALHRDGWEEGRAPYIDYAIERVTTQEGPNGAYTHRVVLTRRGELRMPVEVVAKSRDGEEQTQTWKLEDQDGERYVMVFETKRPLAQVEIDPQELTPDIDRLNNYYVFEGVALFNRKVRFIPTGENDLPLDAYLIRFNPMDRVLEGGYLLDHRWWIGNGFAALSKNLERGSNLSALVGLTTDGLIGQLSWNKTFFSQPELGFLGKYWEATDQLSLTLFRQPDRTGVPSLDKLVGATGRMAHVLGVTWVHQEALTSRYAWWISILNDPLAFTRFEFGGYRAFRLMPNVNLGAQLAFGWGEGRLGIFQFDLRELTGFSKASGYPYIAPVKLLGQLELTLPLQRELSYNLLNFAMLRQVTQRFYLQMGNTWESLRAFGWGSPLEGLRVELGIELIFEGTTLGGLVPWQFISGVVYPLSPLPEDERQIRLYYGIRTPLF